ncbi:hypothetical protein PPACK8108_LOCUS5074 [Phakopsora pachyrhizi]|uniref:Uncharacterized protein n=1 Tax=Phakopsora pachyrhizi TaxID=170000 RepID=A0AAV0ARG3_PHAPC|nr:hypothetical protein PPACK8108_LOCUS5074 [Phakopsora pachyrhizi]
MPDVVERHNAPEVEACKTPKVILMPLYITISPLEYADNIERILARGITRFLSLRFMEDFDWEISEMKFSLNTRARIVAESYLVHVVSRRRIPVKKTERPMGNHLLSFREELTRVFEITLPLKNSKEDRDAELEKLKIAQSNQHFARHLLEVDWKYCDCMARTAEWAGEQEIMALSRHGKKMI